MSTLPEQFSAVRMAQLEAQINFFQNFTARSLESVQQLVALNLSASRASMEKSSAAVAQLLTVKDPRDLFALTNKTQESFNGLLAYSRAFAAIATGTGAALAEAAVKTVPDLKAPALVLVTPDEPASVEPTTAGDAPVAEFVAPVAEPEPVAEPAVIAAAAPVAPPEAEVKPIAKALSKVTKSAAAQPASAPLASAKPVVVTGIKPVDAAPPHAPVSGTPTLAQQQLDLPTAKSKKKK